MLTPEQQREIEELLSEVRQEVRGVERRVRVVKQLTARLAEALQTKEVTRTNGRQ